MNIPEYDGWSNEATWSIFTNFTRSEETRSLVKKRALEGNKQVRSFIEVLVYSWYHGTAGDQYNEALQGLGQQFIHSAIHSVKWSYIYDHLKGEEVAEPPDALTGIVCELLSMLNWHYIVEGAQGDVAAAEMLSDWFTRSCNIWAHISDDRKHRGLIAKFTLAVMDTYMQMVNWDEITEALEDRGA